MPSGKRLTGSGPNLTVEVSQDIIDGAERRDSSHCMIADAIRAIHPEATSISVDLATIRLTEPKKGRRIVWLTPPLAQRALVNFDQGIPTEPFSFRLHKAVQVVGAGAHGGEAGRKKQGIVTAHGENAGAVPIVLGGTVPPLGALASGKAANDRATRERKQVERELPRDEAGHVVTSEPNPSLTNKNKGRIRAFGLRQLKP